MHVLGRFIAVGTQLKVERPGKACTITSCDSIEGPIVKLSNGDVAYLDTEAKAKLFSKDVQEILFLGDILFSYGDFFNRAHALVPPGYCEEWWAREAEYAIKEKYGEEATTFYTDAQCSESTIFEILKSPTTSKVPFSLAIALSKLLNIPLHPAFTYHWKTITKEQMKSFALWIKEGQLEIIEEGKHKLVIPLLEEPKRVKEILGIPHSVVQREFVVVKGDECSALVNVLNLADNNWYEKLLIHLESKDILEALHALSGIRMRDKSGVFIGARMGRPEKAKMRKLTGSPHVLFPIGDEGGRLRS